MIGPLTGVAQKRHAKQPQRAAVGIAAVAADEHGVVALDRSSDSTYAPALAIVRSLGIAVQHPSCRARHRRARPVPSWTHSKNTHSPKETVISQSTIKLSIEVNTCLYSFAREEDVIRAGDLFKFLDSRGQKFFLEYLQFRT